MLRRWVVPPVLLAAMAAGSAGAQVTTTGNIRVFVTDQDSLAVPGATVTAAAEDAATTRVAVTDLRGEAELAALNPSTRYVVTVDTSGTVRPVAAPWHLPPVLRHPSTLRSSRSAAA